MTAARDVDNVLYPLQQATTWKFQVYYLELHAALIAQEP
jgi:hypothetical protein